MTSILAVILCCITLSCLVRAVQTSFNMGAICAKCCLCYCFKLCEFGERFRCCACCLQNCEPCCQCGDCCDVEGDSLPFAVITEGSENTKEGEDTFVYSNGDKYIGEMRDNKKHGYGKLIRKDGTSLQGYFVEDQFFGETEPISTEPGMTVAGTAAAGTSVTKVEDSSKSPKQAAPVSSVSFHKPSSSWATDDRQELLLDT